MKSSKYPLFLTLMLPLIFFSCKKESPLLILETTVASVYGTTAVSGGTVITQKSASIQESGVCWSNVKKPDINDDRTFEGKKNSRFVSVMEGLTPGTEYFYRAYAISTEGVAYGNTLTLKTTPDSSSFLITDSLVFITLRTVKAYASLAYADKLFNIHTKGFCYALNPMPTISDNVVDYTYYTSDGFYSKLTFKTGDIFYVRAFVKLQNGKFYYGEPLSIIPGKIEITTVDRVTFRSARIIIENDPHPQTWRVSINHPHYSYPWHFYNQGGTTHLAYLSGLKPDTTYHISARLRYSGFYYDYDDYTDTVNLTTLPLPYIGIGAYEDPYTIDGALYHTSFTGHVWVEGYIVGEYNSNSGSNYNPPFNSLNNILIAGDAEEIFRPNTLQINLPQGAISEALNLKENPENKGAKIKIQGKVHPASNFLVTMTEIQDFELE